MDEIELKVCEAIEEDAGKGLARLDDKTREALGVIKGDHIMIKGTKETVALVGIGYLGDQGIENIRLDKTTRTNAATGIGKIVKVSKAKVCEAERILITPFENINLGLSEDFIKKSTMGKVFVSGDIFRFSGLRDSQNLQESMDNVFDEVLRNNVPILNDLPLKIESTIPSGAVKVCETTKILLRKEEDELEDLRHENKILRDKLIQLQHSSPRCNAEIFALKSQSERIKEKIDAYTERVAFLKHQFEEVERELKIRLEEWAWAKC